MYPTLGFELTFFAGVYSGCISHTKYFGSDANGLLAISGIFTGVGEILGEKIVSIYIYLLSSCSLSFLYQNCLSRKRASKDVFVQSYINNYIEKRVIISVT